MALEIRLLIDSEYKAANDFFNKACNITRPAREAIRNYDQFSWEFRNGPCGKAIYAAAWEVDEGKEPSIVGIQSVIPLQMISADGRSFLSAKGEDSLIDINTLVRYKKTDILRELYNLLFEECRKKGIVLVWGFNSMYATNKRMGFELPVKSSYGVLVLKPGQASRHIATQKSATAAFEKSKISFLAGISYLYSLRKSVVISRKGKYRFSSEMSENADLFKRAAVPGDLCFLLQDNAYLKWRILENPYPVKYWSFQLTDDQNILLAQVICSTNKDVAFVEQVLFDRRLKIGSVYFLLKKAIQTLKEENICLVRYIGFSTNILNRNEMKMMKNAGFVFTKKGEHVSFVNLSEDFRINPENVYLSRLYKQGIN